MSLREHNTKANTFKIQKFHFQRFLLLLNIPKLQKKKIFQYLTLLMSFNDY